jgi:hypothetical protein
MTKDDTEFFEAEERAELGRIQAMRDAAKTAEAALIELARQVGYSGNIFGMRTILRMAKVAKDWGEPS